MAETIPTELIEHVFSFAAQIDRKTSAALCLTNKLGYRVAAPVLYRTIGVRGEEGDRLLHNRWHGLYALLNLLLRKPELAKHVEAIEHYVDDINGVMAIHPPAPDRELLQRLLSSELGLSSQVQSRFWEWLALHNVLEEELDDEEQSEPGIADEGSYFPTTWLCLTMLACPRLQSLCLTGWTGDLYQMGDLCLALSGDANFGTEGNAMRKYPDGLRNIMQIRINAMENDIDVESFQSVLRLPKLEKLTIDSFFGGLKISLWSDDSFTSNLRELNLTGSIVTEDDLDILLARCEKLRSFTIGYCEEVDVYRGVDWPRLANMIVQHAPLLEELRIEVARIDDHYDVFVQSTPASFRDDNEAEQAEVLSADIQGIGSLQALTNLRKVSAPTFALFGHFDHEDRRDRTWTLDELLPTSVREVEIICAGHEFTKEDKALLTSSGSERLDDLTIVNCMRDKRVSKGSQSVEVQSSLRKRRRSNSDLPDTDDSRAGPAVKAPRIDISAPSTSWSCVVM